MRKTKLVYLHTAVAVCILASSCQKENLPLGSETSSLIGVTLKTSNLTKSFTNDSDGEFFSRIPVAELEGGDSLVIDAYIADYRDIDFAQMTQTKGSVTTTSSMNREGNTFLMSAYLGSENRAKDLDSYRIMDEAEVVWTSDKGWQFTEEYRWRNDVPTTFWSVYPKEIEAGVRTINWPGAKATDQEQSILSFSYSMPCGSAEGNDAEKQEDLLFACSTQRWTEKKSDAMVNVDFQHALAAIRFDVSGALTSGCTVKEIVIDGIAYSGECMATLEDGALSFNWTAGSETSSCSQTFTTADFSETVAGGASPTLQALDKGKVFFFVPQEVKDKNISIFLRYSRSDGSETVSEVTLTHEVPWSAGKIYTYRIGVAEDKVDLQLLETLNGDVKTNVFFRNNGNTKVWVRAALIGNWFNASGAVVGSWSVDDSESGAFEGLPGENWVRKADGFYYYTKPLEPKFRTPTASETSKLFTKYTRKTADDRHLELMVLVQGVRYDSSKTYESSWQ